MGTQPHPQKKGAEPSSPIFGPCLLWPNGRMHQDATWYGGRPRPRRHCAGWGPTFTPPKMGAEPPPQFSPHVYCSQTTRWTKTALGIEVCLDPGHTLCYIGTQFPSPKREQMSLIFSPFLLWPNGWMHQDATWYGGRP